MSRRVAMPTALAAAGLTGVIATVALTGRAASPATVPRVLVSTATVRMTNLAATVLTGGTMGYALSRPLTNQLAGTYTYLPAAGSVIAAGHVLYRVDNEPVIALRGRTPAWRTMAPGISGPDVTELQANLVRLGFASGLFSAPTGYYDLLTAAAVQRWQVATGTLVTGLVGLGQAVFMPAAIRVGALNSAPGRAAYPGQEPYQVTTTRRVVSVPVNPTLPPVAVGERVSIVLPSLARTPGTVTAIGPAPDVQAQGDSGHARGVAAATSMLTVTPDRPALTGTSGGIPVQVSLTVTSVRHVLAVPVAALLALSGGGYGVEVVTGPQRHHLVGVSPGTFAGGLVQISGGGIAAGMKVVVAQ